MSHDIAPPAVLERLWTCADGDPPIPSWIVNVWKRQRPGPASGRDAPPELQALTWFITEWLRSRSPYRPPLAPRLIAWLNAAEVDVSASVKEVPGVAGPVADNCRKPVSRLMHMLWQRNGRSPDLHTRDGYFDFLAHYVFTLIPDLNLPQALAPAAVIEVLNIPVRAKGAEAPLTVGTLLCLRKRCPEEYDRLSRQSGARALAFRGVQEILACGDPRLVPPDLSRFWTTRPLADRDLTAFEYVYASAEARSGGTPVSDSEIRPRFQAAASRIRGAALLSGPLLTAGTPAAPAPRYSQTSVTIYRDHETVAGLSKAGLMARGALASAGVDCHDLHFSLSREPRQLFREARKNRSIWINSRRKCHLINLNPEYVAECCYCNFERFGNRDYVIGQFYWELSRVAAAHEDGIGMVDEIWTASSYLSGIYAGATNRPVITMGQAVTTAEPDPAQSRADFGFGGDTYLFLSNFDAASIVVRKNPLGVVQAFQKAFPRGSERVGLMIKTRNLTHLQTPADRKHWELTRRLMADDPRIRIVDYTMNEETLAALYRMCDCFVSLHRSEGFGFGAAEALAHGRPVIVTDYSGVRDFCSEETAKLVDYSLIRVQPDEYPYIGNRVCEWAEPNLDTAARHMSELASDREQGARLGRSGQRLISEKYSMAALGSRYLGRLRILGFV
jgi:glycosyltransferase involved in cell wall biosynthesis